MRYKRVLVKVGVVLNQNFQVVDRWNAQTDQKHFHDATEIRIPLKLIQKQHKQLCLHLLVPVEFQGVDTIFVGSDRYPIMTTYERHRTPLQASLKNGEIPTAAYYSKSFHLQTIFQSLGYKLGDLPVSEDCPTRICSLPMHPYLLGQDQQIYTDILKDEIL